LRECPLPFGKVLSILVANTDLPFLPRLMHKGWELGGESLELEKAKTLLFNSQLPTLGIKS